jgi:ABC-type phosphate transport system permease subunit
MNKTFKSTTAFAVSIAFLAMAAFCCCVAKGSLAAMQKKSCSSCATKTKEVPKSHECCFSKASPMEIVKQSGILPLLPVLILIVLAFLYSIPRLPIVLSSLFIHGPPGPYRLVPIYIKSRSIRI